MATRIRAKKKDKVSPEPLSVVTPVPAYVIGSWGDRDIDQHDNVIIKACNTVKTRRGVLLNPRFLKSVLDVESGGNGDYKTTQCRPCDGEDCVPACGPFQIKWPFHSYRCPECNSKTLDGQAEMAAHIIVMTMIERKLSDFDAFFAVYFPTHDINGTTQQTYRKHINNRIAQMEKDAGVSPAPTEPSTPVKNVTPDDVLKIIIGGVPQTAPRFQFGGQNFNNDGSPANFYTYAVGHGEGLTRENQHSGTDIFVPLGTRIHTPIGGVVRCVGSSGSGDWGQSCGSFPDTITGGVGNVTVMTDVGLKLTFGHVGKALVSVGDRVTAGQAVALSGGMLSPHLHLDAVINAPGRVRLDIAHYPGEYFLVDPLPAIAERMGSVPDTRKMVRFVGSSIDVPLSIPLEISILPSTQKRQRPGTKMTPDRHVVHETGNYGPGAGADRHLKYLQDGAEGKQLSYHITVDEKKAIQIIPLDEVSWHGGDSGGPCNMRGVSMEICVQDNNKHKVQTRANAEELSAALMMAKNLTRIQTHRQCCNDARNPAGCHTGCPESIFNDGYWTTYVSKVNAWRTGNVPTTPPVTQYATAIKPPEFDGTDKDMGNGIIFYALQRSFVAKVDNVPALQYADPAAKPVRAPLNKGETFTGWYLAKGNDSKMWIITPFGTRIPMDKCSPVVSITP